MKICVNEGKSTGNLGCILVNYHPIIKTCHLPEITCPHICEGLCEPGRISYNCPRTVRYVESKFYLHNLWDETIFCVSHIFCDKNLEPWGRRFHVVCFDFCRNSSQSIFSKPNVTPLSNTFWGCARNQVTKQVLQRKHLADVWMILLKIFLKAIKLNTTILCFFELSTFALKRMMAISKPWPNL